jgi:PAS domain S-box-containing protein
MVKRMEQSSAARQAALLFAAGGAIAFGVAAAMPAVGNRAMTVLAGFAAVAVAILLLVLPWQRWSPRLLQAFVVASGFLVIGGTYIYGMATAFTFSGLFVLVFVWLGLAAQPLTAVALAPLTALAFVLPLYVRGNMIAQEASAAVVMVAVCVLIAEIISRAVRGREEKEAQLAEAQRIAAMGSWDWNIRTDRVTWSDELFRLFGHEPQSFGPTFERFIGTVHPEDRERVKGILKRTIADIEPISFEFRVVYPDGEERVCYAQGKVYADSEGKAYRAAGAIQDISARKAMEDEVAQRDQLEEAQRIARVGSWEWDVRTGQVTYSDELFRIYGVERGAFAPTFEGFIEMVHPDDREAVEDTIRRSVEDHQPFRYESRALCPDGAVRTFDTHGQVFSDDDGVVYRTAGTVQDVTERKAAEELIARHRDQLAEAQRIARLGSWDWDIPTGQITWSDERFRIQGYEPQSFDPSFDRAIEMIHPADRERIKAVLARAKQDLKPFHYESRIVRPDGDVRVCDTNGQVFADAAGVAQRMAGTVQDITQRKAAEEALARQRDQLEEAQRIARVGSWEWDPATNRIRWSDQHFRIYGHEPQSFEPDLDRTIEMIHPEDREGVRVVLMRAKKDLQPFSYEFRIVRPDGVVRICEAHGRVISDDQGVVCRMAGTSQDISERKAIEEQLVQARDRALRGLHLAATLESTEDGILVVDLSGRVRTANRRFAEMWEIPEEMLGAENGASLSLLPYITSKLKTAEPLIARMEAVFASKDETFDTLELKDDRVFELFSRPQMIDGRLVGRVWSYRDVTEKKEAEAALTAAKEAAEEASVAKGTFLANMSHELRTPLNSVIGFANVLLKNKAGNLQDNDIRYLERIQANGQHLLNLINDVLDISKIEVGKMEPEIERFSLSELVDETIGGLRGAVRNDEVELRAIIPDGMAKIATDPGKLKQILINLVGNAIKFTEQGEVVVEVYADPATNRPDRIEVRDTGTGIPDDRLTAIFDAFEQAETGTGRRFGGTGLGLTIAGSLCELLGFELEVESELGVGSTFRILLPRARTGAVAPEPELEPELGTELGATPAPADPGIPDARKANGKKPDNGKSPLHGQLVLVIDDDTDSRILLTHHLEESGARTISASTGEHGIRMAREFRPDLITLDLLLPGMTGWEILRALKTDLELRDIPVVVVSMVADENRSAVVGAAEVIEKPIDRAELIAALRRTLGLVPRRILIVDDKLDSRDLLTNYLSDEGAEIRTAQDGLEALDLLDGYTPDIVLLDLLMPNLDGIELIKKLNEREAYRSIPIVVVTAKDLTREEADMLSHSTLAVLRKGAQLEGGLRAALDGIL